MAVDDQLKKIRKEIAIMVCYSVIQPDIVKKITKDAVKIAGQCARHSYQVCPVARYTALPLYQSAMFTYIRDKTNLFVTSIFV
jgi:hypothetical protein